MLRDGLADDLAALPVDPRPLLPRAHRHHRGVALKRGDPDDSTEAVALRCPATAAGSTDAWARALLSPPAARPARRGA